MYQSRDMKIFEYMNIWDGQFMHSNCNDNKNKDKEHYNDPDAGYCRHLGVKKGLRYDPGILYAHCYDRWLPVYFARKN